MVALAWEFILKSSTESDIVNRVLLWSIILDTAFVIYSLSAGEQS